jgi:hypothetical protein
VAQGRRGTPAEEIVGGLGGAARDYPAAPRWRVSYRAEVEGEPAGQRAVIDRNLDAWENRLARIMCTSCDYGLSRVAPVARLTGATAAGPD